MIKTTIRDFLRLEAAGGILLLIAAAAAMLLKNSPWSEIYGALLNTTAQVRIGELDIDKPLFLWVNDGLMAIFFFMIGMEVKREILVGQLRDIKQVTLPLIGGIGGVAAPALVYWYFNQGDPVALGGWAIPTATDIAFALGILALVGSRVPVGLKLFLMTLAIIDDLAAIIIIAIFYTSELSTLSLSVSAIAILGLCILKVNRVQTVSPYMLVGLVLWVSVLKSGVHATLAGVILGFFIPLGPRECEDDDESPLRRLIHGLHPWVAFMILPVFAFMNAGVTLAGMTIDDLFSGVPLGIALGLLIGKQAGVFGFCFIAIKLGLAKLPKNVNWGQLYGASILTGVGFTMSLFIGSLAFEQTGLYNTRPDRLGIIVGSLMAGILGFIVVKLSTRDSRQASAPASEPAG